MKQSASQNLTNLGFVLAILILLGIIAFAAVSLQALIQSNNLVSHTLIVQETLDQTLALLTDAETGARQLLVALSRVRYP